MPELIINFFLYFSLLFFYWKKYKVIDNGFILLATYTFVALACLINYLFNPSEWQDISLISLLYLFIVNLLFFRPFLNNNSNLSSKIKIEKNPLYYIFIYLYIFFAIIVIYYGYDSVITTIIKNDWSAVRNDVYSGNNAIYVSQQERYAKIFTGFLQPMAVLFFFYLLSENFPKKHTVTIILLLFAILTPSFFTIVSVASRGMVVLLAVQFLVAYFIFKKNISNKINKKIKYTSLIFLSLFAIYSISVTKSRFGESSSGGLSNEAQDSLIFYLGHSMLTFAYGITDTIKEFFWGDYILGNEEILKIGIDNMLGTHFDTNFFTYVGAIYLDFGPFFTFVIALVFPFLMSIIFQYKKKLDMADLMIYLYYLTFLINGVFVVGIGYYIGWVMIFIIYFIFKTIRLIR